MQLLRAIAASAVVAFHSQQAFSASSGGSYETQNYLFGFGAVGVHIFFVLSGLVMVITTHDRTYSFRNFMRRRLLRIYPIYWICCLIYLAVYALFREGYDLAPSQWIGALVLAPADSARIIGPGWTLAYEMFFYLAFAWFMSLTTLSARIGQGRALILLSLAFIGLIAIGVVARPDSGFWHVATNPLLVEFLAGTAIGYLLATKRLPLQLGPAMLAIGLGGYGVAIAVGYDVTSTVATMGIGSIFVVAGAVALEARYGSGPLLRWLGKLGDGSYALYLIHIVVIAACLRIAQMTGYVELLLPGWVAVVLVPLCVAIGQAIHYGIERPILARLNRSNVAARK